MVAGLDKQRLGKYRFSIVELTEFFDVRSVVIYSDGHVLVLSLLLFLWEFLLHIVVYHEGSEKIFVHIIMSISLLLILLFVNEELSLYNHLCVIALLFLYGMWDPREIAHRTRQRRHLPHIHAFILVVLRQGIVGRAGR